MAQKEILPLSDTDRKMVSRFNTGIPILWVIAVLASIIAGFIHKNKNGYFDWWFSSGFIAVTTLFLAYVGWEHYQALHKGIKVRLSGRITSLEHDKSRFFYAHLDHTYKVIIAKEDFENLHLDDMIAINFIPNTEKEGQLNYTGGRIDLSVEKLGGTTGIELEKKSA